MSERFIDNGNGTVTDAQTGWMWQKETVSGKYTWEQAWNYCEELSLAGHSDWHLPTIQQLQSIVDYERCNPAIDVVFDVVASCYWSASTNVHHPYSAWGVGFYEGDVYGYPKVDTCFVRAVRG